jgi:hypothetical protein
MTTQLIVGGFLLVGFLGFAVWMRMLGAKAERLKQAETNLNAIHDKKEIDDEVANLGPADLDARFNRWMRD